MKTLLYFSFSMLLLISFSCKKPFNKEQLQISGRLIYPYSSEVYANVEVQLFRESSKGKLEYVASTFSNSEGNYSFDRMEKIGKYFLKVPSMEGSWYDDKLGKACNSEITENNAVLNYHVSLGTGRVRFNVTRVNDSQEVTDVVLNFSYLKAMPGIKFTKISMYTIDLLESVGIIMSVGEAKIHIKYLIDGQLGEQWVDAIIVKDEQLEIPLLI